VLKRDLDRLGCPVCRLPLAEQPAAESGEASLRCASGHVHPVRGHIPRFVPADTYAGSFGYQWNAFAHLQLDSKNGTDFSESRFRDITGWGPDDLRGRSVLEAGCGAGRFAEIVWRKFGADLVAFDLSSAVEACRANLSPDPPLVVQGSIGEPPFPDASFDFVYCIGVLQHTPDPLGYVRRLCRLVKPGGRIGLWIYENDWKSYVGTLGFKRLLRPLVCRWPRERQMSFCRALTAACLPLVRVLRPLGLPGRALTRLLPVAAAHLVDVPLGPRDLREWVLLDTFDMYASAYDQPQRFGDVARVLVEEGFSEVRRHPHGGVSVTARRG
jgi:SAM-dependent methyltransferase